MPDEERQYVLNDEEIDQLRSNRINYLPEPPEGKTAADYPRAGGPGQVWVIDGKPPTKTELLLEKINHRLSEISKQLAELATYTLSIYYGCDSKQNSLDSPPVPECDGDAH